MRLRKKIWLKGRKQSCRINLLEKGADSKTEERKCSVIMESHKSTMPP